MRAIVVEKAGNPDVLHLTNIPMPQPREGWVLIKVRAFGLNRSEMFTRQGHSPSVQFPRVLGIECAGEVVSAPNTRFIQGQKVVAMMGEMGRAYDGGYAEYTLVPEAQCFAINTDLDWSIIGAIPEMFQTAYGSLNDGLMLQSGQTLLIRGGTSSVGLTACVLAKEMGATVISTTRNPDKAQFLTENGADHVLIDDGTLTPKVRAIYPDGVNAVLELVGTTTLIDSLFCTARQGVVCFTGILGNSWVMKDFSPFDMPVSVRLCMYSGDAHNISEPILQRYIDRIANGQTRISIDRIFTMEQIVEAHEYMESNKATGKLVIVI